MFRPMTPKVDFVALEKKILSWWDKEGLVKKYLAKNHRSPKRFSFLDGPITANNPMGVHHAWGRTLKDLFCRYKNMQGYKQRFQNGFDNQGLWVEVEVEKKLRFTSKRDIEKYGIGKFVQKCKEHTLSFAKIQTEQSKRLGYFMDWDNSYYTLSDENNYTIWYFLKKCWQDGNLYKGRDSVPWCPRCETAISQHEILQEEYHTLTHETVVLKFPSGENEYFLAWTTTPWSIPGTIALMINPEFTYVKVRQNDVHYLLAKERLSALKGPFEVIEEFKGEKLVGRTFKHSYQNFPALKGQKFPVIPSEEFVTLDVGTGIVTNNPGVGHEDYLAAKKVNLEPIESIDAAANFLPGYSQFSGRNAKDNQLTKDILKDLKERGFVYDIYDYSHRYPVCWRCKTELVFRLVDEWYIAMDETFTPGAKNYRQRLMAVVKKIRWIPEWGLERELDWLRNMEDWLISKKRYWGLALPIWECQKCGHFEVIGGKEELKKRAVKGWDKFKGHSPHRPWVDKVKIKCSKCGGLASRIPDVGNPWLDAGIVSFSTLIDPKTDKVSYLSDQKYWQKWFPADFITECFPGQFKNWFYSLLAMSTVLENTNPFKTVLGHALVRDEKGEEMHKSKGNAIEFNEGTEEMGVDVMRWLYLTQNPVHNLNFGFNVADQVRRRFHLTLWNVYNFFVTYANIDGWSPKEEFIKRPTKLDLWILTRLNQTAIKVKENLDDYDYHLASSWLGDFVSDLSLWYVRRSRSRVGPTAQDGQDKDLTYTTLYLVLRVLSRLLAPFTPFLAEEIYQNLENGKNYRVSSSVHLTSWPEVSSSKALDQKLLSQMELVRKICESGHAARKKAKIKVRQPLKSIKVKTQGAKPDKELLSLIKEELNVKEIVWQKGKTEKPEVELEKKITPELLAEGQARELIRKVQDLRKEKGCRLDEKIVIFAPFWPKEFKKQILQETLASQIKKAKILKIQPS